MGARLLHGGRGLEEEVGVLRIDGALARDDQQLLAQRHPADPDPVAREVRPAVHQLERGLDPVDPLDEREALQAIDHQFVALVADDGVDRPDGPDDRLDRAAELADNGGDLGNLFGGKAIGLGQDHVRVGAGRRGLTLPKSAPTVHSELNRGARTPAEGARPRRTRTLRRRASIRGRPRTNAGTSSLRPPPSQRAGSRRSCRRSCRRQSAGPSWRTGRVAGGFLPVCGSRRISETRAGPIPERRSDILHSAGRLPAPAEVRIRPPCFLTSRNVPPCL